MCRICHCSPVFYLKLLLYMKNQPAHFATTEGTTTVQTRSLHKMGNVFIGLSKANAEPYHFYIGKPFLVRLFKYIQ